jgi:hypothetical protein
MLLSVPPIGTRVVYVDTCNPIMIFRTGVVKGVTGDFQLEIDWDNGETTVEPLISLDFE